MSDYWSKYCSSCRKPYIGIYEDSICQCTRVNGPDSPTFTLKRDRKGEGVVSEVNRYKLFNTICGASRSKDLCIDDDGEYVKFEDYEELKTLLQKCLPHLPIHIKAEVEKWTKTK